MSHHPVSLEVDPDQLSPRSASRLLRICAAFAFVGLLAGVAGALLEPTRFSHAYLVGFLLVATLALGSLFFILIHFISRAGWSVGSRRHAEWLANALPLVAVLFLPLIPWGPRIWSAWMGGHGLEHGKALFLNPTFFYVRAAFYLGIWAFLARYFIRRSQAQDTSGDPLLTQQMERASAPALVVFALTVTFAGFDWLMSLDPEWYSTIFGVYLFSGALVGALAAIVLVTLLLQGAGVLRTVVSVEHRHDLGKYLFAFTIFYAYIAFCQYFLIWYANIPEETIFYLERWAGSWKLASVLLIALRFGVPFLLLLSRAGKRRTVPLALAAVSALIGQGIDLYWLVMPRFAPETFRIGWVEVAAVWAPLGLFVLWVAFQAGRGRLYPVRDPRLAEALRFENG